MSTLLSCPFCDGEAVVDWDVADEHGIMQVICKVCGGIGPSVDKEEPRSAVKAADLWNTRAATPVQNRGEDFRAGYEACREDAAQTGYRICAQERHLSLGGKVNAAIRNMEARNA